MRLPRAREARGQVAERSLGVEGGEVRFVDERFDLTRLGDERLRFQAGEQAAADLGTACPVAARASLPELKSRFTADRRIRRWFAKIAS
jgi:hypothetical protein